MLHHIKDVHPHLEISPTVANAHLRELLAELRGRRLSPAARVDVQDGCPSGQPGQRKDQLAVKAARPPQCAIQCIDAICGTCTV